MDKARGLEGAVGTIRKDDLVSLTDANGQAVLGFVKSVGNRHITLYPSGQGNYWDKLYVPGLFEALSPVLVFIEGLRTRTYHLNDFDSYEVIVHCPQTREFSPAKA